jgi:hypothetical protein
MDKEHGKPPATVVQYAPKKYQPQSDPIQLAGVTVEAVDRIGVQAADEIDSAAQQVRDGAEEIARKLEYLANAIREHTKLASQSVAEYVTKTTEVMTTIRGLQDKLTGEIN